MSYEEREDLAVFLALAEYMRRRALEIIERGTSASAPRRAMREAVASSTHAFKVALQDVERWAGP